MHGTTPLRRRDRRAVVRVAALAAFAVTVGVQPAPAQTDGTQPAGVADGDFRGNVRPTLRVPRTAGAIELDGALEDAGWAGAARADNFAEHFPNEGAAPAVRSEVWITYDDKHLYLAFLAFDEPSGIRASLRDRDEMWSDDYFGILLDTYGDAAWAYFLFANPLGVQGDSRFATAGGEDDGFDIVFASEGRITPQGYQIEMAIPFASLRFPNRAVQTWRATFWRTRPRGSREQHTWALIDRDQPCFLCQFGTLTGIEGVRAGGALELLPSVVTSQTGALRDADDPRSGFANDGVTADVSLGARYAFASGLTAEGTYNPDFSQVESDVAQVDVNTTFALFFPERRPFFQEGSDLFDTFFNVVYTRQINNPQFATKLIGRMGRTNVAYLGARDEDTPLILPFEERSFVGRAGKSVSNIARLRQTFLRDSYVGAILSDRRLEDGGAGTVGGVDGQFRFLGRYSLEYQFLVSHTREPNDTSLTSGVNELSFDRGRHTAGFDGETFTGYAQYTSFERDARFWNFDFDYWAYSPTFRADNGFEFRNDLRRVSMWQGLFFYPKTKLVDQFTPNVSVRREWNFAGDGKRLQIQPGIWLNLTGQTYLEVWYTLQSERFAGAEFSDVNRLGMFAQTNVVDPVRVGVFFSRGRSIYRDPEAPLRGTGTDFEVFATLKPLTRLVIQPSLTYAELHRPDGTELFGGYILRTRTSFQFTRELFLRLVVQYDDFSQALSIEPLLTYKVNPFTLFFVGSNLAYQDYGAPERFAHTSRQLFAKFQYLWRR
jgi:hypothetical protein